MPLPLGLLGGAAVLCDQRCGAVGEYVRKARMTPGCTAPLSTLFTPSQMTATRPQLRLSCIIGPGRAMKLPTAISISAISVLAP